MSEQKVTTLVIDTVKYDVHVDEKGQFYTKVEGDLVARDSLKSLERRLREIRRKARVLVPVTLINIPSWHHERKPITVTHGDLTGVHASNGRMLFKSVDGESDTLGRHGYDGEICRRLTEEEVTEAMRIWDAKNAAVQAWNDHIDGLKINAEAAIEEASNKV